MSEQQQIEQLVKDAVAALAVALKEQASLYLQGAQEDLDRWAFDISESVIAAARTGDKERLKELKAQALGILEVNRLRAVKQADALLERAIDASLEVAFQVSLVLLSSGSSALGNLSDKLAGDT